MSPSRSRTANNLVRRGRPDREDGRHFNMPLELGSTVVFDTLAAFEKARDARYATGTMHYGRYGNGASFRLEAMLAKLEGADNICAIMFEAPGSGTFEVPDIPAIAESARRAGVASILDGTWATPIFCQPLALGVDVVVASMSKYLSGHSDCMMGMIACTDADAAAIRKTTFAFGDKTGGQEVFLALRGLRTLKMRMEYSDNARREIAVWVSTQPEVKTILHPAFESCPGHAHWALDFSGAAGLSGVVFHPGNDEQMRGFVDALHHFGIGVSRGGYESLVLPVKPQRGAGTWAADGQLVRSNIGLEDPDTLKADLAAALPLLNTAAE